MYELRVIRGGVDARLITEVAVRKRIVLSPLSMGKYKVGADRGGVRERQWDFIAAYERKEEHAPLPDPAADSMVTWRVAMWVVVTGYVGVWAGMVFAWQWRKGRRVC